MTELSKRLNPFDPIFKANPYPVYRELRAKLPVHKSLIGTWIVADYLTCDQVLRSRDYGKNFADSKFFADLVAKFGDLPPMLSLGIDGDARPFMLTDPPDHTRLRGLVASAFNHRNAAQLDSMIEGLVNRCVTQIGRGDFVKTVADVLPIEVLAQVLGIPEKDTDQFSFWSKEVAGVLDIDPTVSPEVSQRRRTAILESMAYFREQAQDPNCPPGLLRDLRLIQSDADALTLDEVAATCLLIVVAGLETTSNTLGNMMVTFARNPEQYELLRQRPELVQNAVREVLRFEPPAHEAGRIALCDMTLGDCSVVEGDAVMLMIASANRDERANVDGDRFNIARATSQMLTYGRGIHHCLGFALANAMLEKFLAALIPRAWRLSVTEPIQYKPGLGLRGPASLTVGIG